MLFKSPLMGDDSFVYNVLLIDIKEALLGGVRLSLIPLIRSTVIPYP